jgi:hypothetical protein
MSQGTGQLGLPHIDLGNSTPPQNPSCYTHTTSTSRRQGSPDSHSQSLLLEDHPTLTQNPRWERCERMWEAGRAPT